MRKNNKKQFNPFGLGEQKVFKNVPHEKKFNPLKMWYGTITTDKASYMVTYECKFRSEAVAIFTEEARLAGGKLDKYIGSLTK